MNQRDAAIRLCDATIIASLVAGVAIVTKPLRQSYFDKRDCRMSFDKVTDYRILQRVCEDPRTRRAILMWNEIDRTVRGGETLENAN